MLIILTLSRAKAKFKLFSANLSLFIQFYVTAINSLDRSSPHVLHNKLSVVLMLDLKKKKLKSQICMWGLQWHLGVSCCLGTFWRNHLHTEIQSFLGAPCCGLVKCLLRRVDLTCHSTCQSTWLKETPWHSFWGLGAWMPQWRTLLSAIPEVPPQTAPLQLDLWVGAGL